MNIPEEELPKEYFFGPIDWILHLIYNGLIIFIFLGIISLLKDAESTAPGFKNDYETTTIILNTRGDTLQVNSR